MRRDHGKVFDIPFNSKNKYQVHVHCESPDPEQDDKDRTIYMKGAPERIIDRCTSYMTGDGRIVDFTAELRQEVEKAQLACYRCGNQSSRRWRLGAPSRPPRRRRDASLTSCRVRAVASRDLGAAAL